MQTRFSEAAYLRFILILAALVLTGSLLHARTSQTPLPAPPPSSEEEVAAATAQETRQEPAQAAPEQPAAQPAASSVAEPDPPVMPVVPAPQQTPPAAEEPIAQPSSWMELVFPMIKTIGGIGVVLSLILAGFFLFRKYAPQYVVRHSSNRALKLIESLSLGDRRNLMLVQVASRRLLLAGTPGQITLLTSLSEESETEVRPAAPAAEAAPATVEPGNFRRLFELEKKATVIRRAAPAPLPPDIRGKMQELRRALER